MVFVEQSEIDISKTDIYLIWGVNAFESDNELIEKTADAINALLAENKSWLIEPTHKLNAWQREVTSEQFERWQGTFRGEASINLKRLFENVCLRNKAHHWLKAPPGGS